ncbi:hypothetical protein [Peptoniphilus sp. HCN-40583]|uniref:hypothetical protein n=1 Tax=Peptoniphilus sp. HCN-40583 TaxID=3134662 RepID=UPI0030BBA0D6
MKIKNFQLKGLDLSYMGESIPFNELGEADVENDVGEALLQLPNYKEVNEKKEPSTDYEDMSVQEIKKELEKRNIKYDPKAKKAELIELL